MECSIPNAKEKEEEYRNKCYEWETKVDEWLCNALVEKMIEKRVDERRLYRFIEEAPHGIDEVDAGKIIKLSLQRLKPTFLLKGWEIELECNKYVGFWVHLNPYVEKPFKASLWTRIKIALGVGK